MTAVAERPTQTPPPEGPGQAQHTAEKPANSAKPGFTFDVSLALRMLAILVGVFLIQVVFISRFQYVAAQQQLHSDLRLSLAEGAAPVGPVDQDGKLVPLGTPVAVLDIPQIGLHDVIVEGTSSAQTAAGIGRERDTTFPGQAGTSVLMGRNGAYSGAFSQLRSLNLKDRFTITTGQGTFTYEVMGFRRPGDTRPAAPGPDESHLTLLTAGGLPFLPNDVLRMDARLVGKVADHSNVYVRVGSISDSERPLGVDLSGLTGLVLLLEVVVAAILAGMWSWRRWGKWQTWVVFGPIFAALGLLTAQPISLMLPNLL